MVDAPATPSGGHRLRRGRHPPADLAIRQPTHCHTGTPTEASSGQDRLQGRGDHPPSRRGSRARPPGFPWPPDVNEGYVGLLKPHVAPEKRLHGFGLAEQTVERDRLDGLLPPYPSSPYPPPRGKTAEVLWERAATPRNAKGTCRMRLRQFFLPNRAEHEEHQTGRHSLESGKVAYQLFQAIRLFVQDADLLAQTFPHDAGAVNNFIVATANSL